MMSLRALWILSAKEELPLFSRYFPSVEARCKSGLGKLYVKIPPEKEFVKLLLLEVGLKETGVFLETRDRCDKQVLYPAFELNTELGSLWPVVIMECNGLILCTLPHSDDSSKILPSACQVSLASVPSVALALEILNGLAQWILNSRSSLLEGTSAALSEVTKYVNVSLPFGRPVSCDISACNQLTSSVKGKAKVPAWNAVPHKGKSQVVLYIREEIRCMQFGQSEIKDFMDVYGTVSCKAEVEGNVPEISLILAQAIGGLIVNPGVCNVETIGETSQLRFYPSNSHPLCHYALPSINEPPIYGAFSMKMNDNVATISLQLQLKNNVKNLFHQLEVHIPFSGFAIQSVRPTYSQGSVKIISKNIVTWNVGSKFPTKTLTVTLNAIVKLVKIPKISHDFKKDTNSAMEITSANFYDSSLDVVNSAHAMLLFKIADYTYSGAKIDPQSILVSTAAKIRCSVSSELVSKIYKLWNSEGEVPIPANIYTEELKKLLEQP